MFFSRAFVALSTASVAEEIVFEVESTALAM